MSELSNEAENRLLGLHAQKESLTSIRVELERVDTKSDEFGWNDVLDAIEDTEGMIQSAIDSIAEWDLERAKDHAEELADFRRRLRYDD